MTTLTLNSSHSHTTIFILINLYIKIYLLFTQLYMACSNCKAPTEPRNLTVSDRKCNQLKLTWDKPKKTGGLPIINYQITFRKDPGGEIIDNRIVSGRKRTSFELTNLLPGTTYSIEIRANNSIISNTKIIKITTTSRGKSEQYLYGG